MKNCKRTIKTLSEKDLIHKMFMESPIPMGVTKAKDGTYVMLNKASLKYMGLPLKDIIGRTSSELGFFDEKARQVFSEEIKKNDFAKNVPLEVHNKNGEILHMLFSVYPFKIGKESFFFATATDVSENHSKIEKFHDDKFIKITKQDRRFVSAKLKQYRLTSRQHDIALLSSEGHSNEEIAKKLYLSEYTVKDHLKEVFRIMGIRNRKELFPKLINLR